MNKYLRKSEANQKVQKAEDDEELNDGGNDEKPSVPVKSGEDAFKEFICPLCMKLIYKCVTTLCGHSYCEGCLDDYLIYKMVSQLFAYYASIKELGRLANQIMLYSGSTLRKANRFLPK